MISINNNWEFTEQWYPEFPNMQGSHETVRIPHTVKMLPLHYINHDDYQMISGYRRNIDIPASAAGKRLFLQFDGVGHIATVYVNGREAGSHFCGYTAFRVEITDLVTAGETCSVAVRVDSTENPSVPPFGFVIDYLTYGGIYRPVWLDIQPKDYISDVFVSTPTLDTVTIRTTVDGQDLKKLITICDCQGNELGRKTTEKNEITLKVPSVKSWSPDEPNLYICRVELENGAVREVRFGFRTCQFRSDGFYLNGEKLFFRGLNRHQCYPYIGYAAPDSLQREDARILKEELCCNAVRTSHYPQSQAFIDECDRLGLLVFTEIPGWQHIGDQNWKLQTIRNVEEMVVQYRNHPSIMLWGVRINESQDDDELYAGTNKTAHLLDPTRQTSGVRYIQNSSLLEDVYSYNDFSHTGTNPGVRKKKTVVNQQNMDNGYLVSEANGHMFPTKSFDKWSLRQEHALRHARVMNDAMASGEHAGLFQWCMFDYATHKDFGSGDRVCYHGVMDMFRNPKLAASVYSSQGEKTPVLEIGSCMDIGDYPGGNIGEFYVFTNADSVRLYKNDDFVKEYSESSYAALPHGPLLINDLIGELLKTREGFTGGKEKLLHSCLLDMAKYGYSDLPVSSKLKLARAMVEYKMSFEDGVALYGKYVGNWGGEATVWRFDAIKNGEVVASRTLSPNTALHLEARVSAHDLVDGDTYDMAAVRIRILDGHDNPAVYAQYPVRFRTEGCIELVGPDAATLEGGMTGTYVRTVGQEGSGKLIISCDGLEDVIAEFEVKVK